MPARLKIRTCMKTQVIAVHPEMTIRQAAALLLEKKIGTLPVVDEDGKMVGLTSMRAILSIFLPDFVSLLGKIDFIKDFGAMAAPSEDSLKKVERLTIADVMGDPVYVDEDASILRALSVMHKHDLPDIPVLREGVLVGIASWVDIGSAFIADWLGAKQA